MVSNAANRSNKNDMIAYKAPEILNNVHFLTAKPSSGIWCPCCTYVELYTEGTVWYLEAKHSASSSEEYYSVKSLTELIKNTKNTP